MNLTEAREKTVFGHPIGLYYLFFAELWERFSFYGMRALLVLYLGSEIYQDLLNGKEIAYEIYAAYGALVYFTPAIGGMLADRLLGMRFSIILGGILMCLGHFAMALPGESIFFYALGLLIVGNGFFKPNISTMVGGLYEQGDKRRDNAFTIFYMGINIGGFLAPLLCGWLAHAYGWHYGFGLAGIGMLAGILVFIRGIKKGIYKEVGLTPEGVNKNKVSQYRGIITLLSVLSVILFSYMVRNNSMVVLGGQGLLSVLLVALLIIVLIYVGFECYVTDKVTRGRLIVIMFLSLFITVFWSFFEQAGSSLTYFAEESVNLKLLNAAQTNSINSGYIIILAIPFSMMWTLLSSMKMNPNTPIKFALGIFQLGIGFLIFSISARYMDGGARVPMMFLMFGWFLLTTGELFLSPIGLSKITELAPARLVSFLMGVWFLSSAFAHYIAGGIAKLTVPPNSDVEFVVSNDIFTTFSSWASGMDQNEVGSFIFTHENTYYALLDTSENNYPSQQSLENYISSLGEMGKVNEKWTSNAKFIESQALTISPIIDSLSVYKKEQLKEQYSVYLKMFVRKSTTESFEDAYDLLKDKGGINKDSEEAIEIDKDLKKISRKWRLAAEEMITFENDMWQNNSGWASVIFEFTNSMNQNKQLVKPYPALAIYSKVFAQIALMSFFIALFAFVISPLLKYWMHGIK